jgi:methylthioribose-1-phosphate isomerase
MANPPVIEWRENAVHIIDQRVLPHTVDILHCHKTADVCDAIRSLAIRGAPALGVAAAYAIALGAVRIRTTDMTEFLSELDAIIEQVIATRPTAVNLPWAAEQMRATAKAKSESSINAIRHELIEKAHAITQDRGRR